MDPRENPYSPGAGTPPPELADRDGLIEEAAISVTRLRNAQASRGSVLYGLPSVGKTVLLNRIRLSAEADGVACIPIEASEGRSLPAILRPALRSCLIRTSRGRSAASALRKAMATVAAFAQVFKMKVEDVEVSIDFEPAIGVADSGDLENDLADLLEVPGQTAKNEKTVMAMFINELQFVDRDQLAALITAFRWARQAQLLITMFAAGLPQLLGKMGKAKSSTTRGTGTPCDSASQSIGSTWSSRSTTSRSHGDASRLRHVARTEHPGGLVFFESATQMDFRHVFAVD